MIPSELIRSAYPKRCLCKNGVKTVGGFTCIGKVDEGPSKGWHFVRPIRGACFIREEETPERVAALASMVGDSEDDLLPVVDPAETSTWACLLEDLAKGCLAGIEPPKGRWWVSGWHPARVPREASGVDVFCTGPGDSEENWASGWALQVSFGETGVVVLGFPFQVDASDPALALVLARIELRKKEATSHG